MEEDQYIVVKDCIWFTERELVFHSKLLEFFTEEAIDSLIIFEYIEYHEGN